MTVNLDDMTVKFSAEVSGVGSIVGDRNELVYANGMVNAPEACEVTVADASGKVVMRGHGKTADLRALPAGLYIVKAGKNAIKVIR